MTGSGRRTMDVVLGLLAMAAAALACFVCGVMWVADFSGVDDTSDTAGTSAMVLALGIVVALVTAGVRRSWAALWVVLLCFGLVAALPWAQHL